jgi:hypothetical protein
MLTRSRSSAARASSFRPSWCCAMAKNFRLFAKR